MKSTRAVPEAGAVSGLLFGCVSLGGMVFPLLLGVVASSIGIERSYILTLTILVGLLLGILLWIRRLRRQPATASG